MTVKPLWIGHSQAFEQARVAEGIAATLPHSFFGKIKKKRRSENFYCIIHLVDLYLFLTDRIPLLRERTSWRLMIRLKIKIRGKLDGHSTFTCIVIRFVACWL
jgi:hypothetical protein